MLKEVRYRTDQVCEMASVMYQAAKTEDDTLYQSQERIAQLEKENAILREVLSSSLSTLSIPAESAIAHDTTVVENKERDIVKSQIESDDSRSATPKAGNSEDEDRG